MFPMVAKSKLAMRGMSMTPTPSTEWARFPSLFAYGILELHHLVHTNLVTCPITSWKGIPGLTQDT